ncbi:beta-agarase [Luteibacter sp. ME-Dv--P-043b]|uniref:beta-agarase n=1 Tax=Luteibacter sp. ME-Dv--P-043b TaxID=3040291 RepID=UPI002556AFAD|nr:beta-agarase [Luteibacter sp. ME-Dv--P-043b]
MRTYLPLLLLTAAVSAQATTVDLVHPTSATHVTTRDATLDATPRKAADGGELVAVTFKPSAAPSLVIAPAQGTWAWQPDGTLRLRLQNGMPWPVTLIVDIASGEKHLKTVVGLPPGPPQTLSVTLKATSPRAFGMQVGPPMPFDDGKDKRLVATAVDGAVDAGAITSVTLSMPQPGAAQTLLFGTLDTVAGDGDLRKAYTGIVDRYGQYTRATWPEKIDSDAALKERAALPAGAKDAAAASPGLDRFGGRLDRPALKVTGFFHTQKQGDRWWLVTPEGHAFFSLGVNAVNLTDARTYVQGREFMFLDPGVDHGTFSGVADSRSDQGSQRDNGMNHGRWWDIYSQNVSRSLGNDFASAWRKRSVDRLRSWRFNTLGNWSDPAFATDHRIAYTVPILIKGDFNTVSTGYDYWGRMPDPFDPRFLKATQAAVANASKGVTDDPWLLGYFADNELAWAGQGPQGRWALAVGSLAQGPESPAKQAFLAYLKKTHGDAASFAKAWGVNVTTWDQVAAKGFKAPDPSEAHPAVAADNIAFLRLFADQYFRTVAQTLKKADPHHLFLGGRLAVRTPEVEQASAAYADVTSINTYTDVPEHGFDVAAFRKMDKPVMITEFHFGSADRGPFGNGVAAVGSEEERGKAYARFVDAAVASGVIVGTHWFQYIDQPVTGRVLDGENSHIGLVGITDIPFKDFTRAVTDTNARVGGGSGGAR